MTTLVVTDLDGTAWDSTMRCHPATLEAISALQHRDDVELMVATGRRRTSTRQAFAHNGFLLPSVLLNGSIGFDFVTEAIFHEVNFATEALEPLLQQLQSFGLAPVVYLSDTRVFAIEGVTTGAKHLENLGSDLHWASFDELATRSDILGMSMLGVEQSMIAPAFEALRDLAGVEASAFIDHMFPPHSLMLAPENVTKALGITAYCDHIGLVPDRVIALGDGGNDLEMLAMADVALAVAGSDERAVALADHLIERPEHGGWAAVLDYL